MSKDWTPDELTAASAAMKAAGHMSYEEFCAELERILSNGKPPHGRTVEFQHRLSPSVG